MTPCTVQPSRTLWAWAFSRPEYWSGLPGPSPGDLPDPGMERSPAASSHCQVASLPVRTWEAHQSSVSPFQRQSSQLPQAPPEPRSQVEGPLWKEVHPEGCLPRAHLGQGPQAPQRPISCGPVGTGLRFPGPQAALASSSKVLLTGARGRQWWSREQRRPVVARKPWRAGEGGLK